MDTTIEELTKIIFSHPPNDICTFNIIPRNINILLTDENHDAIMFPILMDFMLKGIRVLYGDIELNKLTIKQIDFVKRYMASIGYQVIDEHNISDKSYIVNIWFKRLKYITDCDGINKFVN